MDADTSHPQRRVDHVTGSFYETKRAFPYAWASTVDQRRGVGELVCYAGENGVDDWYGSWSLIFHDHTDPTSYGGERRFVVELQVFEDALEALRRSNFVELLTNAPEGVAIAEFSAWLVEQGWQDRSAELRGTEPQRCLACHGSGFVDDIRPAPSR